ncbi:alpha-amylase family glycosyl hydrolase [Halopelagius fulvigenes]|uniref:Alpha-amylase family glycosyl hydrolase n=1 Tax=Halopelagius fulvigenes TaxID=1198324 RepID=A0ABD5U107_9EURY
MHHPGPPRFTHVGSPVELAPRNPDATAAFSWRLLDRPEGSEATVGVGPVVHLDPDVPGAYRLELDAPDGTHRQTVRAFPDPRTNVRVAVAADEVAVPAESVDSVSVIGRFNDFTMGRHRATFDEDEGEWAVEARLPPGDHNLIFAFDDGFEPYADVDVSVEGPGRPRVSLDGRREGDEIVVAADADPAPDGSRPDVEFYLDDRDSLSRDDVLVADDELRVTVDTISELTRVHAVPVTERHGIADTLELAVEDGEASFRRPADPPEWVRDATMYQIFVHEFAGETVETTFEEIRRRVPYLEHLGVDTLWLTPVVESPTRHGYHITDLFDTASDLGTREEFESLVDRLREAGIRVLFDLVVNHTSRDHPAYQLHEAGVEGYEDLYGRVPAEEDTSDVEWAADGAPAYYFNWTKIPNLNYDSLRTREWMLDVVDEWLPVADGFRCDVAWGVPHGFWKEVRARAKAHDPDFLLLDETVPRDADFRENEFDLHYDTDLYYALRRIGGGEAPATELLDALADSARRGYPDEAAHMRYVENHDEDRYLAECGPDALRAAAAATLTLPGTPMIYYGQERGVTERRGTMKWHDGDGDSTAFHRRLVAVRNEEPALRSDRVEPVTVDVAGAAADDVVAYERGGDGDGDDDRLVVVLNFGGDAATVSLDRPVASSDLVSGDEVATEGGIRVEDAVVLRAE